eukprot:6172967-Pleurochrysis_carterae.AAC.1
MSSTLYVVVLRFLLDVSNMPEALKEKLRLLFAELNRPAIVVETHCVVSSDLTHDNAFVRHVNDKYITPYAQCIGKFTTTTHDPTAASRSSSAPSILIGSVSGPRATAFGWSGLPFSAAATARASATARVALSKTPPTFTSSETATSTVRALQPS